MLTQLYIYYKMSEAGRIDPTAQMLLHDSIFVYR